MNRIDETGHIFGKLTVLSYAGRRGRFTMWLTRCECGIEKSYRRDQLVGGHVVSCGCWRRDRIPIKGRATRERLVNIKFKQYQRDATKDGKSWELTFEQFDSIISKPCFYCGASPEKAGHPIVRKTIQLHWNGVDRFENEIGYNLQNCVPCCSICNYMKRCLSAEAFIHHCQRVVALCPDHLVLGLIPTY